MRHSRRSGYAWTKHALSGGAVDTSTGQEIRHLTHYFQNGPFTLAEQLRQNDQMVHSARDGCLEEGLSGLAGILSDAHEAGDLADGAGGAIAEVVGATGQRGV